MNKVKFGLNNVHVAKATINADGTASYSTPFRIPGAVSITMDAAGDKTDFYADDIDFFSKYNNAGYEGPLEIALVPDQFRKEILGDIEDANGVLVENADAPVVPFALMFEFDGDANKTRHVMYNCVTSRPSVASNTKEASIEVQTEELNMTASTIYNAALGVNISKAKMEQSSSAPYTTWYSSVYQATGVSFAALNSELTIAAGDFAVAEFNGNTGDVTAVSSNADIDATVGDGKVVIVVDADAAAGGTITLTDEDSNTTTVTVTLA